MRQQFTARFPLVPVGEVAGLDAIFARLVVLAADAAEFVADGEQEIVVLIVFRVKQFIRLLDQRAVRGDLFRRRFELFRAVGHHVQVHRDFCARVEVDAAEIAACEQRRIEEGFEVERLEGDLVAVARGRFQRGAELPARWHGQVGLDRDVAAAVAGRVNRQRLPLHAEDVVGKRGAALARFHRRQVLEFDVDRIGVGRHVNREGPHVERVAAPVERLAVRARFETGKLVQRAAGAVIGHHPLRVQQGQLAGLGRNGLADAEDLLCRIGGVYF